MVTALMNPAKIALLFVVLLDVMGQGLVIPVLTTILTDPSQSILPADTPTEKRQFLFGLTMGLFFLSWFFGAAFIAKLSDFIGRRFGILICLGGGLTGYVQTIVGLDPKSFALMLAARIVTGFTAGNQPIAQAALVDASANEEEKTRSMGFVVVSISLGLVAGPLIGGLLSAVFFCSQLALNSFFVFLDDYLKSRFGFDTLQNSIVLIIFGIAIAVTGAVIVAPITKHFPKQRIIYGSLFAMAAGLALFILNPIAFLSYFMIIPFVVAWAVNYPVMLTLFSGSVGPSEQGWVMGVTVALYTLGAGKPFGIWQIDQRRGSAFVRELHRPEANSHWSQHRWLEGALRTENG